MNKLTTCQLTVLTIYSQPLMNSYTFKHFVCNSPDNEQRAMTANQPLLELEPSTAQAAAILVPPLTREQCTDTSTPNRKRFKSSMDEGDSDTEDSSHTLSPDSGSSSCSNTPTAMSADTRNMSNIRRRSMGVQSQAPRRQASRIRPTDLFPRGSQESRELGLPAELVTPEARPVQTNNGSIHIVGLVNISPVTHVHRDNNDVLHNNNSPRHIRRAHTW